VGLGRQPKGIDFNAHDNEPVYYFFLIVAPPLEASNQFLPVVAKLAQLVKEPDVASLLAKVATPEEFLQLIDAKDIS